MVCVTVLLGALVAAQPPVSPPKGEPLPVPPQRTKEQQDALRGPRWGDLAEMFEEQDKKLAAEKLAGELKKERNTVARLTAEMAELRGKNDRLTNTVTKLGQELATVSNDPRPVVITQVLIARTAAVARCGELPEAMEKKLSAWEKRITPTIRAANEAARVKHTDWLTALKTLDGSGKTPDLLTFREAAELVRELNAFTLELHLLIGRTGGNKPR